MAKSKKSSKAAVTSRQVLIGGLAVVLIAAIISASVGIASMFWKVPLNEGNNAIVRDNPGEWFYNGSDEAVYETEPYRQGRKLSVTAKSWGKDYFYFRYQPGEKEGLNFGDEFKVTFKVELSADGKVVYRYDNDSTQVAEALLKADEEQELTLEGCVYTEGSGPFYIGVPSDTIAGATLTVRNVEFEVVE